MYISWWITIYRIVLFVTLSRSVNLFFQGMELHDVRRRISNDSRMSVENALLNVAQNQISASMTKLNSNNDVSKTKTYSNLSCIYIAKEKIHISLNSSHLIIDISGIEKSVIRCNDL